MGNVKQPVLFQQGQSVFIECERGAVITHDGQCIRPLQISLQPILLTQGIFLRQACPEEVKNYIFTMRPELILRRV